MNYIEVVMLSGSIRPDQSILRKYRIKLAAVLMAGVSVGCVNANGSSCPVGSLTAPGYADCNWTTAVFEGQSAISDGSSYAGNTSSTSIYDWDVGFYKGDCSAASVMTGVSYDDDSAEGHAVLCDSEYPISYQEGYVGTGLTLDDRQAARSVGGAADWDVSYWKWECPMGQYVAGISQDGSGVPDGLRCGEGLGTGNNCATYSLAGAEDDRGFTAEGDWDVSYYKVECAAGQIMAGISVDHKNSVWHMILCCDAQ